MLLPGKASCLFKQTICFDCSLTTATLGLAPILCAKALIELGPLSAGRREKIGAEVQGNDPAKRYVIPTL